MDKDDFVKRLESFIERVGYNVVFTATTTSSNYIDHVNKIIYIDKDKTYNNYYITKASTAIALWLFPNSAFYCTHAVFENNYKIKFDLHIFTADIIHYLIDNNYRLTDLYRTADIGTYFHRWLNRDIVNDYKYFIKVFINKIADPNDTYYNTEKTTLLEPETVINNLDNNIHNIINNKFNGYLGGACALALNGKLYRERIKDFDYFIHKDLLGKEIDTIINDNMSKILIYPLEQQKSQNKIKELFEKSEIYKELKSIVKDINIIQVNIYKYPQAENSWFISIDIKIDGKNYDITIIDYNKDIPHYTKAYGVTCYYTPYLLRKKKALSRRKDIVDIINWKPYYTIEHDDELCITRL